MITLLLVLRLPLQRLQIIYHYDHCNYYYHRICCDPRAVVCWRRTSSAVIQSYIPTSHVEHCYEELYFNIARQVCWRRTSTTVIQSYISTSLVKYADVARKHLELEISCYYGTMKTQRKNRLRCIVSTTHLLPTTPRPYLQNERSLSLFILTSLMLFKMTCALYMLYNLRRMPHLLVVATYIHYVL